LVADAFALRVHELESRRLWQEQQASLTARNALLAKVAASDDFVVALTEGAGVTLADLFGAGGAAVIAGKRAAAVGAAPPPEDLLGLSDWLRRTLPAGERVFATDRLSEHYGPASTWRTKASGLLGVLVGDGEDGPDHALLWFRPEVAATVVWGGDPRKPVLADTSSGTVLPRRSFERWVEERRGQAEPWAPWQVGTAGVLAAAMEGSCCARAGASPN
jgi:light-regulated signal transduction histidine kinase (bacteriophytochrome)